MPTEGLAETSGQTLALGGRPVSLVAGLRVRQTDRDRQKQKDNTSLCFFTFQCSILFCDNAVLQPGMS